MSIAQEGSFQLFTCRNSPLIRNLEWLLPFSEDLWNRVVSSWTAGRPAKGHPGRVSLVGIHEGDGASLTSIGLAYYLSESLGYRTCVVEADLRSPSAQNEGLAPSGSIGLKGLLSGECSVDEVIFHVDPLGFQILPAGPPVVSPSALITDAAVQSTCQALGRLFDVVLLDSPPLNMGPENSAIVQQVDATVLVLKAGHTLPPQAGYWIGKLEEYQAKLGAVCLNGVRYGLPSFLRRLI